jgi:hypothetical protein
VAHHHGDMGQHMVDTSWWGCISALPLPARLCGARCTEGRHAGLLLLQGQPHNTEARLLRVPPGESGADSAAGDRLVDRLAGINTPPAHVFARPPCRTSSTKWLNSIMNTRPMEDTGCTTDTWHQPSHQHQGRGRCGQEEGWGRGGGQHTSHDTSHGAGKGGGGGGLLAPAFYTIGKNTSWGWTPV